MFIFFVCFLKTLSALWKMDWRHKGKYGKIKKSVVIGPFRSGGGYMFILEMNNSHTQDIFYKLS